VVEAIRIYIGTEPNQWLPTEVLKHSILKRTKEAVEFHELKGIEIGLKQKMYTGFSFFRYYIPELCGYQGKAVYLDADMVCLGDIGELFRMDFKGKGALSKVRDETSYYTSCMPLDCEKLTHWKVKEWALLINAGLTSYSGIMSGDPTGINHDDFGPLDPHWNSFDRFDARTKLIHYTTVPTQPWKRPGHPYREPFLEELKSAAASGAISKGDIEREIEKKHIYEGLLQEI